MQQLFHLKSCDRSLLKNSSGFLWQNATVLLQNSTVITKCDVYYDSNMTNCDSKKVFFKTGSLILHWSHNWMYSSLQLKPGTWGWGLFKTS